MTTKTRLLMLKKMSRFMFLAALGCGYFTTFNQFEMPFLMQGYLFLFPIQVGTLVYFFWWQKRSKLRRP